ncbi:hypothetical protein BSKO_11494 [Bryopsis sp. KO-2023]|nr:hypothetical protein BSKO_11494 [Bryopsis sp. KO-2023]
MAIARRLMVAIALTIISVGAEARGLPSSVPAAPKSASDIFSRLGLEGLTLDMFPGGEGETVTRTFSNSPGETQTVAVTRTPGGAVSVKTQTQFSSLDGLSTASPDLRPSQLDFASLQSAFESAHQSVGTGTGAGTGTGTGTGLIGQKVFPGFDFGSVAETPAPVKAVAKIDGAKKSVAGVVTSPAAPKKKSAKKASKKTSKKVTKKTSQTQKSASKQSAVAVDPLVPIEMETIDEPFSLTAATEQSKDVVGVPTLAAPLFVTPTRDGDEKGIAASGRIGVSGNTRASTKSGPTSDFKAARISKDGVTATVVSGSSVAPFPATVERATGEDCSDTETTTEAVERCVNAVRQNPSKYAKLLACDIPVYTPRSPLATSSHLGEAAAAHAQDMATVKLVTHSGSDGSTMGLRIWERAGFVGSPIAENVAGGQTSARDVVFAWMCSDGHRKNIMSCNHDSMGTGLTRNGRLYWAQTFGCTKYNKCVC